MWRSALVLLAACGRIAFDPLGDGGTGSDASRGDITSGLLVHLEFEDDFSSGALDSSGNGHTASCTSCPGSTGSVPGRNLGTAATFNGTTNVLEIADRPMLRPTAITVALWIYARADMQLGIVQKVLGAVADNTWQVHTTVAGRLRMCSSRESCSGATELLPLRRWNHLLYTNDGGNQQLFLDGVRLAIAPGALSYDEGPILIGADRDRGATYGHIDGAIDDVRIYGRVLDSAAIGTLAAR